MDHPAALHRLQVGVPATVEHASGEGNAETSKAVAETTQVCQSYRLLISFTHHGANDAELYYLHGRSKAPASSQRPAPSTIAGVDDWICKIQRECGMGGKRSHRALVRPRATSVVNGMNDAYLGRLVTLNAMKASDEITEDQSRQVASFIVSYDTSTDQCSSSAAIRHRPRLPRILRLSCRWQDTPVT